MISEKEYYQILVLRVLLVLLSLVTIYFVFAYFFPSFLHITGRIAGALVPFIMAVVVAVLIDPLIDWLVCHKGMQRGVAVAATLLLALALIILLLVFLAIRLLNELTGLYGQLPLLAQNLMQQSGGVLEELQNYFTKMPWPLNVQEAFAANLEKAINSLTGLISTATDVLFGFLTGLSGYISIVMVAFLATFFVSRDKQLITSSLYRWLPRKMVKPSSTVVGEVSTALTGFFRAQLILVAITTVITILGLAFLRVQYGLTIGIIAGLLDFLPALGPGVIFLPWALGLFLLGNVRRGLGIIILYGIIVGVRQLIEPRILSRSIGLHPLVTLLSLYLGFKLLGIWGIIAGPFLVIVSKSVYKAFRPQT